MPTPHPPRPHHPPSGRDPGDSDEVLAARLTSRADGEAARAVALLTARHWRPMHDYAVICLASSAEVADMVTAVALRRLFGRLVPGEQALALRPRLLAAVRDTVREWAADEWISAAVPELQKPAGGRGMRTAKSLTPENRLLAERAFQSLPGVARCLLWHIEVEAEPITVPAGLLGLDTDSAWAALEQAREKFREQCVHAHRELAPSKDCRFYNRLLDVPMRRGGALLPDVRQHLAQCRHCRDAADQLGRFDGGLGPLIAEAVLGWGARRYLDSRPGRTSSGARGRAAVRHRGGRARLLARIPAAGRRLLPTWIVVPGLRLPGIPRSPRALLTGVGAASAGVLATVLVLSPHPYDGSGAGPAASTATTGTAGPAPSGPDAAGLPAAPVQTRLRNAAADLCLDIRGEPKAGAGTELAVCSATWTQQWSYENDGLLRSVADPGLCLDSHADAGVIVLGTCADRGEQRADDVRYDLTVRGELLPRGEKGLALTATTGDPEADVVAKVRDGSAGQRWRTDPARATDGSLSTAGTDTPAARPAELPET
ncbi:hydrolase [Streptomyces fumigatiscleroticus]|nr:hydrolase [Streptomyces fumigatiscleroticus]